MKEEPRDSVGQQGKEGEEGGREGRKKKLTLSMTIELFSRTSSNSEDMVERVYVVLIF